MPGDTVTSTPGRYAVLAIHLHDGGAPGHPITLRASRLGAIEPASDAIESVGVPAARGGRTPTTRYRRVRPRG